MLNELLFDDKEVSEIMSRMKKERSDNAQAEKRKKKEKVKDYKVFGEYDEITEQQFLPTVTNKKYCVVHFYHREF